MFCGLKIYASRAEAEKQIKIITIKLLLTFFFIGVWSCFTAFIIFQIHMKIISLMGRPTLMRYSSQNERHYLKEDC